MMIGPAKGAQRRSLTRPPYEEDLLALVEGDEMGAAAYKADPPMQETKAQSSCTRPHTGSPLRYSGKSLDFSPH
jgi:hypothetical protein